MAGDCGGAGACLAVTCLGGGEVVAVLPLVEVVIEALGRKDVGHRLVGLRRSRVRRVAGVRRRIGFAETGLVGAEFATLGHDPGSDHLTHLRTLRQPCVSVV